jgi:hypothetical protein
VDAPGDSTTVVGDPPGRGVRGIVTVGPVVRPFGREEVERIEEWTRTIERELERRR